jgi:hypothetical protein
MAGNEWQSQMNIDGFSFYREDIGDLIAQWNETQQMSVKGFGIEDLEDALRYCDEQVSRLQDEMQPAEPPRQVQRLFKAIEEQRRLAAVAEYQS